MSEKEMLEKIERLQRELAEANKSRDRLREMLCAVFPVDSPDVMEAMVVEMMQHPMQGIDDIIEELQRDEPPGQNRQIPA
jgi:endonuclease YncB( thermonuclease family)